MPPDTGRGWEAGTRRGAPGRHLIRVDGRLEAPLQDDAGPSPRRRRLFQRDQELSGLGASLLAAGLVLVVLVVVVGIRLIHGIGGDRTSNAASTTPPAAPSPAPPGGLPQPGAVRTPTTADAGGGATVSFDLEDGLT